MRSVLLTLLVLVMAACGGDGGGGVDAGDGDGGGDGDGDGDGGAGACAWADAEGQFSVTSSATWGGFGGQYRDVPWPVTVIEQERGGECAYFGPANPFCDPACDSNQICVTGGTCQPYPTNLSAGHLSVAGTTPPLELDPQAGFNYYTTEAYPDLFAPGDLITLTAEGDRDVAPFELSTRGIAPLTVPWTQVTATEGQDMDIPWDPAGSPEGTVVIVHMDNDHHGIQAFVECVAADDGSVTIPAAVIDRLILAGETGIGTYIENAWIARVHADTIETASGCVGFRSESLLQMGVETVRP